MSVSKSVVTAQVTIFYDIWNNVYVFIKVSFTESSIWKSRHYWHHASTAI